MLIEISEIIKYPEDKDFDLKKAAEKKCGLALEELRILKKSIDARKKNNVRILYRVSAKPKETLSKEKISSLKIFNEKKYPEIIKTKNHKKAAIIGTGPAGLFAALRLLEYGHEVVLYERGKTVENRAEDIKQLEKGILNTESNIVFGEGGAGTWSDGKLTTGINRPEIYYIFKTLIRFGAPSEIMYEAKPHIGTDNLKNIIINLRKHIEKIGGTFRFEDKVESILIKNSKAYGIKSKVSGEKQYDFIIAATGHSARDFYKMLYDKNFALEAKPFALGFRIEHPTEFINKAQFGKSAKFLPSADYKLTFNNKTTKRSVYSFCMCPGGYVVNSSSEEGALCVNGMSNFNRNAVNSNSAIVTTIRPEDFMNNALSGIELQRLLEKNSYTEAGNNFNAPACQAASLCLNKKGNISINNSSYLPGVVEADFKNIVPENYLNELITGLKTFNRKIPGFIEEGIIVGTETRTSSPVRIVRGKDYQSVSFKNFYPAGEGAGYAGGIVSSAVDGIRAADAAEQNNH